MNVNRIIGNLFHIRRKIEYESIYRHFIAIKELFLGEQINAMGEQELARMRQAVWDRQRKVPERLERSGAVAAMSAFQC